MRIKVFKYMLNENLLGGVLQYEGDLEIDYLDFPFYEDITKEKPNLELANDHYIVFDLHSMNWQYIPKNTSKNETKDIELQDQEIESPKPKKKKTKA